MTPVFDPGELEHEPRPVIRPHNAPHKAHVIRSSAFGAALQDDTPEPPCTGCPRYRACAVRREVCDAWRQYISRGWRRTLVLEVRQRRIQPMKKFRD